MLPCFLRTTALVFFVFSIHAILCLPEARAQGCAGADTFGVLGGVASIQNGFACVNVDNASMANPSSGAILEVTVTNVLAGDLVEARINWNDGSGFTAWFPLAETGPGTRIHRANSPRHYFPDLNTNCEYTPTTEMRITTGGVTTVCSTNWGTPPVFFRWNLEGAPYSASSVLDVTETATSATVFEVCAGVSTTVTFTDRSNLNCNTFPGDVTVGTSRNDRRRWRQFVYGGAGALNTITGGVTVGVTAVPQNTGLNGDVLTYNITSGAPAGPAGGTDSPASGTTFGNPPTSTQTLSITVPATAQVGEEFVITTRYWNPCNRYDQGAAAVEYNATRIRVVAQPAAPTAVTAAAVCNGQTRSTMPTFGITGAAANSTVRWYANVNAATPKVPGTVGALITTTTASGAGASSIPFSTAFPGAGGTVMPAENYIVWATYLGASGSLVCESFPVAITRSVREPLSLSGQSITPTINGSLCPTSAGHTFQLSMPAAPNAQPVGGNTEYIWTVPANWSITGGQGTNQITASLTGAASGSQNVSVIWRYTTNPQCASGSLSQSVTVLSNPAVTANPPNRNICEDGSTTFSITATGSGLSYRWQIDADGPGAGGFVDIPAGVGGDPYTGETSTTLTVDLSGLGLGSTLNNARYRARVTGTCGTVDSNFGILTVNLKPDITVQPVDRTICVNATTTFEVTAIGQATLQYTWQVDDGGGGGFVNVVNGGPYSGQGTSVLTVNTTGLGSSMDGNAYRVIVGTSGAQCGAFTDQSPSVQLNVDGPTTTITTGTTVDVCADANLPLAATESFSGGAFASRVWTGTYDENFGAAPALVALTPAQLDALLTDGVGGSRRTALNPIFNSAGLGASKVGAYVLTLTTTDNNGCTNFDVITINVTEVDADILYGFTAGTVTNATLNASICAGSDLFLNGNPSGGSGLYTTHTWTKISGPGGGIATLLSNPNIRNPIFNSTTTGTYELAYFVEDDGGCNFTTNPVANITIVVSPLPVANDQTPAAICSNLSGVNTAVVDLTALHNSINNTGTVTFAWFTDAGLTAPIATPAAATVTDGVTIYARVREIAAPNCFSVADVTYTIDTRPDVPASNGDVLACSDDIPASTLSVAAPAANVEIDWYDAAVGGNLLLSNSLVLDPAGVNEPAPGGTVTFYAEARNTVSGCLSSSRVPIDLISDHRPSNPTVGAPQVTCSDAAVLTGSVPDNGGTGTWTIGNALYYQTFPPSENGEGLNGTTGGSPASYTSNSGDWILTVPAGLYSASDPNDWFQVDGGTFSARDVNDITVRWESRNIDISAFPGGVRVSIQLARVGDMEATDQIAATYAIDGGAEIPIGSIVEDASPDAVLQTFNVLTGAGTNLKIYVRVRNNADAERHIFDNVQVYPAAASGLPLIANVNDPASAVTNLQDGPNTFTWTITSALGACTLPPAVLTITKNPQPVTVDINFDVCETVAGSGERLGYDLNVHNAAVSDNEANRAVTWFLNATLTNPVPDATNVDVNDNDVYYARVVNTLTGCTNETPVLNAGSVTFNVQPLPATATLNPEECENGLGTNEIDNVDLTTFNVAVAGGIGANRAVTWWLDPGVAVNNPGDLVTQIGIPTDVDDVNDGERFYAVVENTLTGCLNVGVVEFTILPLPFNNPIIPPGGGTPASITICASNTILLFQVDPTLNAGSTYAWTIPTGVGEFELFGGGGLNDFFVLLRFPNVTAPAGLNISVVETSADGCVGNVNTMNIRVDSSPPAPVITGDNNVCSGQENVTYSVPTNIGSIYTWNVPGTLGSIVSGQGTASITVNISTTSGVITVTETNSTGCISPPAAPFNVTVNNRPAMTSPNTVDLCSGETVSGSLTLVAAGFPAAEFDWVVIGRIGPIGGASVGNTGSGPIGQTLTNTSSSVGQIVYDVTPKVDIDPTAGVEYCNGPTQTVTVDVHPEPVGQADAVAVCSDVALVYDIQADNIDALGNSLPSLFTYTVASSNAGAVPPEPNRVVASNAPINHTYTNLTTANVTITYTITPVYDDPEACVGDPFVLTVTVRPEPDGNDDAVTVCGSDPVGYDLVANIAAGNNLTAGTTFSWVAVDNPDVTGESTAPQAGNTINDVIVNQTLVNEDVVYTVTPISSLGCNGNPFNITVTVRPTPVGSNSTATVCSDTPVGINLTTAGTAVAAATYNISVNPNGLTQSAGTPSNANGLLFDAIADDAWRNTGLNPVNVVYTVVPVSAAPASCEGAPFTVTITINPEPVVLSNTAVTRCSDLAVNVTLSSSVASVAAATYNIATNANGLTQSGGTVSAGPAKAANELVDDVWRNTGLVPVDVVYTITPVSLAGCAGDPFLVTVTVNPEPVGVNDTDIVCSDQVLNYTLTTSGASVAAATFNIVVNPNGLIQSAGTGSGGNNKLANELEDDVWRNIGLNPVDVEYTITPVSAAGCQGDSYTVTITVRPEPVANNSAVTVCSDSPVGVTLTTLGTAVAAASYNIVVNNGGLIQSGGLASAGVGMPANALADDEWENTGLNPVNVIYTVTPVSAAGCAGDAFTVTVTINPEPVGADAAFVRCSDQVVGVNLTTNVGSVAATSYNIVVDPNGLTLSAGTASAGNGRAASEISDDVWRNTGLLPVVVTYTVTPVSAAGCLGDPFDVEVTVRPEPVGVNSTAIRCSDQVVGITLTTNPGSVAADTYTIAVAPNGLVLSAGTPSAGALKAANEIADDVWRNTGLNPVDVVYTIIPVSADGCSGDAFTRTITVRPEPVGANSNLTRCSDQAVGANLTTSALAVAAATYDIVVTDNGLFLSGGIASGGTGLPANAIADDVWRNTTNSTVNVIYTVTPVSADGCEGNAFTVTVAVDPEPVLAPGLDDAVCSDQIVDLVLATAGGSVAASGYNITNRVVAGALTPVSQVTVPTNGVAANYLRNEIYRNTTNGNLDVVYTILPVGTINGCSGDPVDVTITIQPEPVISPTLDRTVCSDAIVNLTLATNGTSVNALDYNIVNRIVAPGLVPVAQQVVPANNVAANYLQNEIYRNTTNAALAVQYEVQATGTIGNCLGDTRIVVVTINPEPVISTTLDANRCSDATVGLVLNTNGVSVGALNYDIISRTAAGALTPVNQVGVPANGVAANYLQGEIYRNTTTGSLTVQYEVRATGTIGGCVGDAQIITITIDPEPIVLDASNAVCSDNIVNLTLSTDAGSVGAANYNIVSRTVAGALTAVSQVIVPANNVGPGYLTNEIYRNTTNGNLTVQYVVQAVGAINGCLSDPRTITMTIQPEPVIATTLNATVCSDQVVGLVLNTNGTSVPAATYNIVSRTVAGALTPVNQVAVPAVGVGDNYLQGEIYANTGSVPLTVQYVVEARGTIGNCLGDTRTITITIDPEPVVSPTLDASVCSDAVVGLILNTNGTSVGAASYDIVSRTVAPSLIPVNQVVVPANGVGTTYLQNEVYRNLTNGNLTVSYVVHATGTVNACEGDDRTITMTIQPEPVIATTLNDVVCSDVATGLVLNTAPTSIAAASYNIVSRTVAGGLTPVNQVPVPASGVTDVYLQNEVYRNTTNASLTVQYVVEARGTIANCLGDQRTITITIDPEPVVAATLNDDVCSGAVVGLVLNTNGVSVAAANYNIVSRTVDPALNPVAQVAVPQVGVGTGYLQNEIYENTTNAPLTVTYVVEAIGTINGCLGDQRTIVITIDPEPVIQPGLDATVCSDNNVNLVLATNGTSVGALNYDVLTRTVDPALTQVVTVAIPGNAVSATYLQNERYRNTTALSRNVVYEVRARGSINGCLGDVVTITMTIDPEPVMAGGLNDGVCSDQIVGLVLNTNGSSVAAANYNIVNRIVAGGLIPVNQVAVPQSSVADNYLENEIYRNTTGGSLTVQYVVEPVGTINGCLGDQLTITMTIAPEPVVSPSLDAAVCSDNAIGLVLNTNGTSIGALNYDIVSRTVQGGLNPISEVGAPALGVPAAYLQNDIYNNPGALPLTVTYEVRATGTVAGCQSDIETIVITINPEPVMSPALDIAGVCSDLTTGLVLNTNGASVAAANYDVQSILVAGGLTPQAGNAVVPFNNVAATYLQNDVFRNTGSVDLDVEYSVRPRSGAGCVGDFLTVTVTVRPEPVVATNLDETLCSDLAYGKLMATNGVSVGAASYDVTAVVDAGLAGVATTGNTLAANAIQANVFTNTTSTQLLVVYTLTPNGTNGCIGDAKVVTFRVNPEPVLEPQLLPDICSNNTDNPTIANIVLGTNGVSVNAGTYQLTAIEFKRASDAGFNVAPPAGFTPAGTNAAVLATSNFNLLRNDRFENLINESVTVKYTVVPRSPAPQSCAGDALDFELTVNPQPKLDPSLSPTPVCSDVATGVVLSEDPGPPASVAAATYIFRTIVFDPAKLIPNPANAGVGTGRLANALSNDTYTNTTGNPELVTYTIAPVSAVNCVGPDENVVFTINPAPNLNVANAITCNDDVIGVVLATTFPSDPNGVAAANYRIENITIDPDLTRTAGNAAFPRTIANVNDILNDRFANPTLATQPVVYRVVPISAAACEGPAENVTVTIEPTIQIVPNPAAQTLCGDGLIATSVQLNSGSAPTAGTITFNYSVAASSPQVSGFVPVVTNLGNGTVVGDFLVNNSNVVQTTTYTVTPVAAGAKNGAGCTGTAVPFVITLEPKPKLTIASTKTICEDDAVSIALNSPTVPSGGAGTVSFAYTANVVAPGAGGDVTGFSAAGSFANGATLNDVLVNNTSANRQVNYTLTPQFGTCVGDPVSTVVTVAPRPVITPIADFDICSGELFNPVAITVDTDPAATFINWTVTPDTEVTGESNGAGNAFSQVLFNPTGDARTITYTLQARNVANVPACNGAPVTLQVGVYPVPKVTGLASSINVCEGETRAINLSSSATGTTFAWTVDNNANPDLPPIPAGAGAAINQTFENNGTSLGSYQYVITPTVVIPSNGNSCVGTDAIMIVNVAPAIVPQLYSSDGDDNAFICLGGKDFVFFDFGGLPLFEYTYTDGTTTRVVERKGPIDIVTVQPTVTTTYQLLKVKDGFGCEVNPTDQRVTVNVGSTDAAFRIAGPEIACSPYQVEFEHNQVNGVNYTWKWFDGVADSVYTAGTDVPGQIVRHTFFNPSPNGLVRYKVFLETRLDDNYPGNCLQTSFQEVKVYPTVATGVFADRTVICADEEVTFVNSSQGVSTHRWFYRVQGTTAEFDVRTTTNTTFALPNNTISNPIVLEVVYQSTNGNCPAEDVVTPITVYRNIEAGFTYTDPTLFVGGHSYTTITNTSQPIDGTEFGYAWDFGLDANPQSADGVGPFNLDYTTPGPKEIFLRATNLVAEQAGLTCFSDFKELIQIAVPPLVADFVAVPLEACFPADVEVTENLATGDIFEWRLFDDLGKTAATSNANLPVFTVVSPGKYTIELTTRNSFTGDQVTALKDVVIYPLPVASFDVRPNVVFVPDTELNTFNFSSGATEYEWDFGDGTVLFEEEPKHKYRIEGLYDVMLIAKYDHGNGVVCVDSLTRQVVAKQGGVTRIPNAFTPNPFGPNGGRPGNNSFNDVFLPQVKGVEEFNMQIFDRWGNLIFESNDSNMGWDGYDRNGRLLPAGVYVYKLTLRLSDGQRTTQLGDITMIR